MDEPTVKLISFRRLDSTTCVSEENQSNVDPEAIEVSEIPNERNFDNCRHILTMVVMAFCVCLGLTLFLLGACGMITPIIGFTWFYLGYGLGCAVLYVVWVFTTPDLV
ncbi:hypothetical protein CHUAL_003799 [Chamberlinius hualienensis]